MNNFEENKKIIEESQLSDFDKKEALEYVKHGFILFNKLPYYYKICDDHDDYYDDLYDEAHPKYFLDKYIPLCEDDYSKQSIFNEWAEYWKGEIVPYIKSAIDMGWKINFPIPKIIYIFDNKYKINEGESPILFKACEWRDTDYIKELLENGTDPNICFDDENSLECLMNGHNVSYTDYDSESVCKTVNECLDILGKYGLNYEINDRFKYDLEEYINICIDTDLKKRLETIKFK